MGNAGSFPGIPSAELKLKSGDRRDHIPYPFAGSKSFGNIFADIEFKEFVLQNLQSYSLISSILHNASDESVIVDGIRYFQYNNAESRKIIISDITKFHQFTAAGIKGQLADTLKMSEREVELHQDTTCSPFLRSFQCRLAAVRAMEKSVVIERKRAKQCYMPRHVSTSILNSRDHPHLSIVCPMLKAGLSVIRILPLCLPAATETGNAETLTFPLIQIVQNIDTCDDMYLFSCWSPPPQTPVKKIEISPNAVYSNTPGSDACNAVNATSHAYWSCSSGGGVWVARMSSPVDISMVAISWTPLSTSPLLPSSTICGAPKKLVVMVRSGEPGSTFRTVTTVDVDDEHKTFETWNHRYVLNGASHVTELMLQMSGLSQSNQGTDNTVKMFGVDVLANDVDATWIDMLAIMQETQHSLLSLKGLRSVEDMMYTGLLSSARVMGSLSLLLELVSSIHTSELHDAFQQLSAAQSFYRLIRAIRKEDIKIRSDLYNASSNISVDKVLKDVGFDATAKSPEMVITDDGASIGGNAPGNSYGLVGCQMDSGIWEWEITVTKDNRGDETSCLGVARRHVVDCNYDSTADMWLVRCYNGDVYHGGRQPKKRTIPHIHPNDICRFTFDADGQTLALAVNNVDVGVIFENVERGVSPAVAFYGSGKKVQLLSIKKLGNSFRADCNIRLEKLDTLLELPCVSEIQMSKAPMQICSILLGVISNLTSSRVMALEAGIYKATSSMAPRKSAQVLEYPYCIQVSREVFTCIFKFLSMLMNRDDSSGENRHYFNDAMIYLLRILDGQFACLILSEVDPSEAGLHSSGSCDLVQEGHILLKDLMLPFRQTELRQAAAEAFSQGIPLFLSSIGEKIDSVINLIDEVYVLPSQCIDKAKCIVLTTIMKKISKCSEVVKMLEYCKQSTETRATISMLIKKCLFLSEGTFKAVHLLGEVNHTDEAIVKYACEFMSRFQEQLVLNVCSDMESSDLSLWYGDVLVEYCQDICYYSEAAVEQCYRMEEASGAVAMAKVEQQLRKSFVCTQFIPLAHSLCFCLHNLSLVRATSPYLTRLYLKLSSMVSSSPSCQTAQALVSNSLKRVYQKPSFVEDADTGWRRVSARFEDSDPTFLISDDGTLFTSAQSSNTCAVVMFGFSGPCRAAWEFKLEADSIDDECAVFGAAHMPISSRSYSGSSDLYMRRAYNGYLYNRGRTIGVTMSKIHTGDLVRVEFDGRMRTISYSINGGDLEVAFTDVTGEVYPCCGSYRNNVRIRLVKVEMYGSNASKAEVDDDMRAPEIVHWVSDNALLCIKDPSTLEMISEAVKPSDPSTPSAPSWLTCRCDRGALEGIHAWNIDVVEPSDGLLAVGVVMGGHPYCSDMLASPCAADISEVPVLLSPRSPRKRSVGTGFSFLDEDMIRTPTLHSDRNESVDLDNSAIHRGDSDDSDGFIERGMESIDGASFRVMGSEDVINAVPTLDAYHLSLDDLPPSPHDFRAQIASVPSFDLPPSRPMLSRTSTPADSVRLHVHTRGNTPPHSPIMSSDGRDFDDVEDLEVLCFDETSPTKGGAMLSALRKQYSYEDSKIIAMSWCSDGSLWLNGEQRETAFGKKFLPLTKMSIVTVQINIEARTVEYFVNGEYVGVAFGPKGSGAAVCYTFPSRHVQSDPSSAMYYPAASISSSKQSLKIRAAGYNGSTVLPTLLFAQKTLASVLGRCAASLMAGPRVDKIEVDLSNWMKSPLLSGGLEPKVWGDNAGAEDDVDADEWDVSWTKARTYSPKASMVWNKTETSDTVNEEEVRPSCQHCDCQGMSDDEFLVFLSNSHSPEVLHKQSADPSDVDIKNLMLWLDDISPDPPFLKAGLQRSGTYNFPRVEYPVIACMLKHCSLLNEARKICNLLRADGYENMQGRLGTIPSATMSAMWMKIKQLRSALRRQRQFFMSNAPGDLTPKKQEGVSEGGLVEVPEWCALASADIKWATMPHSLVIRNQVQREGMELFLDARVVSIGVDYIMQHVYIKVALSLTSKLAEQTVAGDLLATIVPPPARLDVNGVSVDIFEVKKSVSNASDLFYKFDIGGDRGDCSPIRLDMDTLSSFDLALEYGSGENCRCVLLAPASAAVKQPDSIASKESASVGRDVIHESGYRPQSFDEFCDTITRRANFLLSIIPSSGWNGGKTGSSNPDDMATLRSDMLMSSQSTSKWLSDDATGWKNVTDVLRMQKRMRNEQSKGSLPSVDTAVYNDPKDSLHIDSTILEDIIPGIDLEGSEEDVGDQKETIQLSHKIMQECALFIASTDEAYDVSLTSLTDVLRRRHKRARFRSFGMDMLNTVLKTTEVIQDPFSVEELLLFVRSSLCMGSTASSTGADLPVEYAAPDAHYLSNLEGCSIGILEVVQTSFLGLYSSISNVLESFISAWTSSTYAIADIDSKSPDVNSSVRVEVPRSVLGAIFTMLSCWSLHFSGRDHHFLMKCSLLPTLNNLVAMETYENAVANWMRVASRKLELLRSFARYEQEESESLQSQANEWKLWDSTYVQSGLQTGRISCRALLFHICQIPDGILDADEKNSLNFPPQISFEEICARYSISQLSLLYEKMLAIFRQRQESRLKQVEKARAAYKDAKEAQELVLRKNLHDLGVPMFDRTNMSSDVVLEDADQVAGIRDLPAGQRVASAYATVTYNFAVDEHEHTGNYFEMTILEVGQKDLGIGLAVPGVFPVTGEMPGWEPHSYGYHGDDGRRFGERHTTSLWPTWSTGDVIGCGFDVTSRSIFFTHNGTLLGDGFTSVEDDLLKPVVSFHAPNVLQRVRVNFGTSDFVYRGAEVHRHPAAAAFADQERSSAASLQSFHQPRDQNLAVPLTAECVLRMEESEVVKLLVAYGEIPVGDPIDLQIRLLAANANHMDRCLRMNACEEKEEQEICETKDDFSPSHMDEAAVKKELTELNRALDASFSHINELINLRNYACALIRFIFTTSCVSDGSIDLKGRSKPLDSTLAEDLDSLPDSAIQLSTSISTFGTPTTLTIADSMKLQEYIAANSMLEVRLGAIYLSHAAHRTGRESFVMSSPPVKKSGGWSSNAPVSEDDGRAQALLELCEIDTIMEKHLFGITAVLLHSSNIQDLVSTPENIKSLLAIRKIGSPRLQRLAIHILSYCLPNIPPEVADESFTGVSVQAHIRHDPSRSARTRQLPDRIVQSLLARVKTAVAVPSQNIWKNFLDSGWVPRELALTDTHNIPLGYGQLMIWEAGLLVSLLQKLFESTHWMEVISCCLTDSFRVATTVLRTLNQCDGSRDSDDLTNDEYDLVQHATAACIVFSGVGSLFPGAAIMNENGQVGRVVYKKQGDEDINVVFVDPELGPDGLSYESIISVTVRSIHVIPQEVDIDLSTVSQPIIEELVKLLRECLTWFKRNSNTANGSFLASQLHRLCAVLTTSFSVLLESQSEFVMDSCRQAAFELKDIVETAVIPIPLFALPSLYDLCRMRIFCQARILEAGAGCIANTRIKSVNRSTDANDTSTGVDSNSTQIPTGDTPMDMFGESKDEIDTTALCTVSFDDASRASRIEVARIMANDTSLPITVCLSRLEYFSGDREKAIRSLSVEDAGVDFQPIPLCLTTFSDDNVIRHCDFDINDTGRASSDTVACGFRSPYACTVSRLSDTSSKKSGASSTNSLSEGPPELSPGNIISSIDDDGALIESNFHLELCMSSGQTDNIIAMFCDYDLGVDLYHGMRRADGCVVSHLYETKIEDFPELMLSLDISLTIVRLRQLASKMISDRSINLQRDAGGKEQWLSLLKYIMRGEIMTAGETKDFGKMLSGICDSVLSSHKHPGISGGRSTDALRVLMIEDILWNLSKLMESSTISSSCMSVNDQFAIADFASGYYCASTHPLGGNHSCIYDIPIPDEWRGVRIICDERCSTIGEESSVAIYCSKEDKPRFHFYGSGSGDTTTMRAEQPNHFASYYIPGVKHLQIKFSDTTPPVERKVNVETRRKDDMVMQVADFTVSAGECVFFEVNCEQRSTDPIAVGLCVKGALSPGKQCIYLFGDSVFRGDERIDSGLGNEGNVLARTIGCLYRAHEDYLEVWFAREGVWSPLCHRVALDIPEEYTPMTATFSVMDECKFNFGDTPNAFPPNGDSFPSHWTSVAETVARKGSANVLDNVSMKNRWGYRMLLRPLESLAYVVARDFDLIAKTMEQEVAHNGKVTMVTLYFWRPKRIAGYKSCGDIVTRECRPPRGAIAVHVDHCMAIKKYTKAFFAPKHEFTVWRPLPPEGYAALGDVVTAGSTKPSASASSCIPLWALKECGIGGWIFKTKSKSSGNNKSGTLCSIWDVNSHMGYFVGSASDRRDFSRRSSDGTMNVVVGYTFKTELVHVITGEWAIDIDSPSLMWTVHLIDFMLDHPQCRSYVLTKNMFSMLLRFMTSKYSPDGIAIVPVLIKMVRYSLQYSVSIGINTMRSICKLILQTAFAKCKGDIKGGKLPGAVLTLVDLVCEATSYQSSEIFRNVIETIPFDANTCVHFLSEFYRNYSMKSQSHCSWIEQRITDFHMQFGRVVLASSDEFTLSGKTHALHQLGSIKRFLQYLNGTTCEDYNDSANRNIDLLPPELILFSWFEHLKACVLEQSAHPYSDTVPQKYTKKIEFPCARFIYVTIDKRSCLGPNSTLKLSGGSDFSMTLRGDDIGEKRTKSIVVTGTELELEFEVAPIASDNFAGTRAGNNSDEEFWGWSLVISGEGPLYAIVSSSIDLSTFEQSRRGCLDSVVSSISNSTSGSEKLLIESTFEESKSIDKEEISRIAKCKVEKISKESTLTEADILDIKEKGVLVAGGSLRVPFAHELKIGFNWQILLPRVSAETRIAKTTIFAVEIIPLHSVESYLFHVWEGCKYEHVVKGAAADYKLYQFKAPDEDCTGDELQGAQDEATPSVDGKTVSNETAFEEEKSSAAVAPPEWSCPTCTFINVLSSTSCDICGMPNPMLAVAAVADDEGDGVFETNAVADTDPVAYAVWICSRCTWNNRLQNVSCEVCQSPRDIDFIPTSSSPTHLVALTDGAGDSVGRDDAEGSPSSMEEEDEVLMPLADRVASSEDLETTIGLNPERRISSKIGDVVTNTMGPAEVLVLTAEGVFSRTERLECFLTQAIVNGRWTPVHLKAAMAKWTRQADDCLLEYFNSNPGVEKLALHPLQWTLPHKYMTYSSFSLCDYNLLEIQSRSLLLCALNSSIKHILPIIDIANPDPLSLGAQIRRLNKYIMINVKQPMLQRSIDATMSSGVGLPAQVTLDNFKAILSLDRGDMDPSDSQNCFVQAFHQLNKLDSKVYRFIFNSDRVFQIHFEGESGIDAGGVFREGVTRIVEDLFDTKHFNLLVLCPNGQNEVHMNIDKCLPNPSHTSPLAIQMMEFVGKIMAMSIRAKLALPFNFPSLVWKKILKEEVTIEDLRAIDVITCSLLEAVRHCENDGITNHELFREKYGDKLRFTYTGCDGVERELFEGGRDIIVDFDTRESYCDQVLERRLAECDKHIEAILSGMEGVIQLQVINLFSWSQLEVLVGGNPVFDLEVWKAHTESSIPARNLEMFWNVIESLTPKEQEGFVRFAWGRSRLPPAKEFTVKMKLVSRGTEKLPVAHTCFFSIELPNYKTEEEMRHGILTAIHFGATGILMG